MANTPSGTVLTYTVDIVNNLLSSSNKVDAERLGDLITNFGDRLLDLKHKEEGVAPAENLTRKAAPAPTAAPVTATVKETKPAEAPAPTPEVVSTAKRKPGRPKGSGKKKVEATEATSEVLTGEVILPEAETTAEVAHDVAAEETILEFNNPDPKAPDYKFKHLLDRFGVNPDGTAKRFNNMTEEDTFDGEIVKSLFDGQTRKMLKRHLGRDYGMTVKEYITHFGLSKDYRPVGKDFSASKSIDAKKTKLGHKTAEGEQEAVAEQPIATPVKAVRRTRARASQAA